MSSQCSQPAMTSPDPPAERQNDCFMDSPTNTKPAKKTNEILKLTAFESTRPEEMVGQDAANSDYPDGGLRAWMVVCGSFVGVFSTSGLVNSWGVFQSYYETKLLQKTDPSRIAWIGSIQYALVFLPGLVTGRLFDLGYFRIPYAFWSAVFVASIFVTAQCSKYWQFLLCQGLTQGLAVGMTFGPATAVLGHWFLKRRGLVFGFMALGASIGGTAFPILTRTLISRIGYQWTMRIIGFIALCTMTISNLVLRRRLPPKKVMGGLINTQAFKNPAFTLYCWAQFTAFLGVYTVLTYIDVRAISLGVPADFSFYLVSIANAGSAFGRVLGGLLVDRFGVVNITAPATVLTAVLTFVWPLIRSKGGFIGLAIPYGFSSGIVVSTFSLPMYSMGDIEDAGRRMGMVFSMAALGGLAGPPIDGAIIRATGNYKWVGVFAGSVSLVSVGFLLWTRYIMLRGKLFGKF